jgi:NitT/TauT family transport system permease protein
MIASEHGLGQSLTFLASTFDVNGVMALLLVLAVLGVVLVRLMSWVELRLLRWQ